MPNPSRHSPTLSPFTLHTLKSDASPNTHTPQSTLKPNSKMTLKPMFDFGPSNSQFVAASRPRSTQGESERVKVKGASRRNDYAYKAEERVEMALKSTPVDDSNIQKRYIQDIVSITQTSKETPSDLVVGPSVHSPMQNISAKMSEVESAKGRVHSGSHSKKRARTETNAPSNPALTQNHHSDDGRSIQSGAVSLSSRGSWSSSPSPSSSELTRSDKQLNHKRPVLSSPTGSNSSESAQTADLIHSLRRQVHLISLQNLELQRDVKVCPSTHSPSISELQNR